MSTQNLSVACLGAGYFAQFHHEAWQRLEHVTLIACCDSDLERAKAVSASAFSTLDAMLNAVVPDILDIATPPDTHASAISQALDAGVSTIICQKPFCRSLQEATQLTEAAAAAGARLIVHENFRFQPWYRLIGAAIEAGEIGTVQQASFRLRTGDGQGPDAYMERQPYFQSMPRLLVHETAIHYIDTFRFLFGEVHSVYADLRRLNPDIVGEDAGYILLEMDHGVQALFDGNRHLDHAAENTRLTLGEGLFEGTRGSLSLHGNGQVRKRTFGHTDEQLVYPAQDWPGFAGDSVYAFQQHVVSHLLHGTMLETAAQDYLENIRLELLVYRSSEEGRRLPTNDQLHSDNTTNDLAT